MEGLPGGMAQRERRGEKMGRREEKRDKEREMGAVEEEETARECKLQHLA